VLRSIVGQHNSNNSNMQTTWLSFPSSTFTKKAADVSVLLLILVLL